MTFEEWWEETKDKVSGYPTEYHLAKDAWNKAIEQAADEVRANYDPCEPWIEVSDIEDLSA